MFRWIGADPVCDRTRSERLWHNERSKELFLLGARYWRGAYRPLIRTIVKRPALAASLLVASTRTLLARPFSVGGGEGGGGAEGGVAGWLIEEQARLTHLMAGRSMRCMATHMRRWR